MPIIKSAKKRVRVARKATARNIKVKRSLKTAVKAFNTSISDNKTKASEAQAKAQSALDKAVKKGIIHKNKAARKKRQLTAKAKLAGVKVAPPKKSKNPAKSAGQRTVSKKPAAKKAPAKSAKKRAAAKRTTKK